MEYNFSTVQIGGTWHTTLRTGSRVYMYAECPLGLHEASAIAATARHDAARGCSFDVDGLPELVQRISRTGRPVWKIV